MKISKTILLASFMALCSIHGYSESKQAAHQPIQSLKLEPVKDIHTYSRPEEARVTHVDLNLAVDFERKVLQGYAVLTVQRSPKSPYAPVIFDTENLAIKSVEAAQGTGKFTTAKYSLGPADKILGAPLTVELPAGNRFRVKVTYRTSPDGSALQWLTAEQTAGKKYPYLFTQSEAIHGRSWIPFQDTPGVRQTYSARITVPQGLVAVMSAEGNPQPRNGADEKGGTREFRFHMNTPIPSYLIALAVGDLAFRPIGARAGVYDEPTLVDRDAKELEDVEQMIKTTEKLYGPYKWGRYDVLILPPSFPYGGMENPRLTFASPTIIAGDKSLVSVISHELAHSWSGNLVTNATWSDFWLNEGFTTYIERRIVEAVYGERMAKMQMVLGRQILARDVGKFEARDQILHVDLQGRDPDDGSTELPYEKGSLFLKQLENTVGRGKFDRFLNSYFQHFAFHSITTKDFLDYLDQNLVRQNPEVAAKVPIKEWIYKPGVPANAPVIESDAFALVEAEAKAWLEGRKNLAALNTKDWTTQEWLHFLKFLPANIGTEKMNELDGQFHFTRIGNIEILQQWLLMSIANRYETAYPRLEETLMRVGRRKIVKPLYDALIKTSEGRERAIAAYKKARPGYHPILSKEVDQILGVSPAK